jgi:hypothetical protein
MTEFCCTFGIVRDGEMSPVAVFSDLEDAIDWAMERIGANGFCIRHIPLVEAAVDEAPASARRRAA